MPEWSNGMRSRRIGLVPSKVRILFPALKMDKARILSKADEKDFIWYELKPSNKEIA